MPDVLDYLRAFRSDTPGPSTDAWTRARLSIEAAAGEAQEAAIPAGRLHEHRGSQRDPSGSIGATRRGSRETHRRTLLLTSTAAVCAALVAGLLIGVLESHPALTHPETTAWHAARPLPNAQSHVTAPSGTWLLADYITSEGWQQNTTGPEPGNLTCPSTSTCYVTGDNATSSSGPAKFDSFYVSTDGALTWSVLPVPTGVSFTTALACSSALACSAGATYSGQPVFITTSDGGHSFTLDPLPSGVGTIHSLVCPSDGVCAGLVSKAADSNDTPIDATLLRTTDDGSTFTNLALPAGASMESLACPTSLDCVAVGTSDAIGAFDWTAGVVAQTSNGGQSWTRGALPGGFGISYLSRLSCSGSDTCQVLGYIAIDNQNLPACGTSNPSTSPPPATPGPATSAASPAVRAIAQQESAYARSAALREYAQGDGLTCSSGGVALVSDIASTNDGGLTWTPEALPATAPSPSLSDITCPSATFCVATGSAEIAQRFSTGGVNDGSAIVLSTIDGGATWRAVGFAVPSDVPSGVQLDAFMAVGDVQCPTAGACVALGVSNQGSKTTPVYTYSAATTTTSSSA